MKERKKPVRTPLTEKGPLGKLILALRAVKMRNANEVNLKNFGIEVISSSYRTEEGLFDLPAFKNDFANYLETTKGVSGGIPLEAIKL